MNILITGGAGFIGTNFVYYMINKYPEYNLIVFDKLTYAGNIGNLKPIINKIKFIKGDISDKKAVDKIFKRFKPDMVVNFAAESHVDRSIKEPSVFLKTNVIGTQILLDACLKYNVNRFHQISTDEVYGDLPLDSKEMFTEKSILRPSSPYSASKASADLLTLAYHRTHGLPVTISRCSNNYGPYQHIEKFIPCMITRVLKGEPLTIYGNGLNIRDWIYVDDHCRALDLILHKGQNGGIYNIGGKCENTNIDIARTILKAMNKSEEKITFTEDRKGHDLRYAVDVSKMESEFNWKSEMNFNVGLPQTIDWYINKFENGFWAYSFLSAKDR